MIMNKIFYISYIGTKYKNVLVLIVLLLFITSKSYGKPPPPPGPCRDCIKLCYEKFVTCRINSNSNQCGNHLSECNKVCNLKGCLNVEFHFNCLTLDILPKPTLLGKIIGPLLSGILLSFVGFFLYKWNK